LQIDDPIVIVDDFKVYGNSIQFQGQLEKMGIDVDKYLKHWIHKRGVFFGVGKSIELADKFLDYGELLQSDLHNEDLTAFMFFLDEKKAVLFKVNKRLDTWRQLISQTCKLIEPLGLTTRKQLVKEISKWRKSVDEEIEPYVEGEMGFWANFDKFNLSIRSLYCYFLCIQASDYEAFKERVAEFFRSKWYRKI